MNAAQRLIGSWKPVRDETDNDTGEGVTMEFSEDGRLTYSIDQQESVEIMNLTYRVDGNEFVTDRLHRRRSIEHDSGSLTMVYWCWRTRVVGRGTRKCETIRYCSCPLPGLITVSVSGPRTMC